MPWRPVRLAQVANFLGRTTGGLRAVVNTLGQAHCDSGGERQLIIPARRSETLIGQGWQEVRLGAPKLPLSGNGYHVLVRRREVIAALESFAPDVVEVHDQTTLGWVGPWARANGVASILFAHERLDHVLTTLPVLPGTVGAGLGRRWTAQLASRFDMVVCASQYAAEPFEHAENLCHIPFGVDLVQFRPPDAVGGCESARGAWGGAGLRLLYMGRLYREKAPELALDVIARLRGWGVPAVLVMAGHGPMESRLRSRAVREGLPIHFVGHVPEPQRVASLLGDADVVIAPGPRETFGLSALEALACGTPVVAHSGGAACELVTPQCGRLGQNADELARGVYDLTTDRTVLAEAGRRARQRAQRYPWTATARRMAALRADLLPVMATGTAREPASPVS
ncbi:MAG: glycosyltransferase [Kineosporiaceae bacterium]